MNDTNGQCNEIHRQIIGEKVAAPEPIVEISKSCATTGISGTVTYKLDIQ